MSDSDKIIEDLETSIHNLEEARNRAEPGKLKEEHLSALRQADLLLREITSKVLGEGMARVFTNGLDEPVAVSKPLEFKLRKDFSLGQVAEIPLDVEVHVDAADQQLATTEGRRDALGAIEWTTQFFATELNHAFREAQSVARGGGRWGQVYVIHYARLPRLYRSLLSSRYPAEKTSDTQVFVKLGPVDVLTVPDQAKRIALLR